MGFACSMEILSSKGKNGGQARLKTSGKEVEGRSMGRRKGGILYISVY